MEGGGFENDLVTSDMIVKQMTVKGLPKLKDLSQSELEQTFQKMIMVNPVLFFKGLPTFEESLPRTTILRKLYYGDFDEMDQLSLYDKARLMTYDVSFEDIVELLMKDPALAELKAFAKERSTSYRDEDILGDMVFYYYPTIIPDRWARYFQNYLINGVSRMSQGPSSKGSEEAMHTLQYLLGKGVSIPSMRDLKSLIKALSGLSYIYDRARGTTYLTVLDTLFQNLKPKVQFYSKKFGVDVFEDVFYKSYWEPLLQMIVSFFDLTTADINEFADVGFPLSDPKFLGLFETAGKYDGSKCSVSSGVFY